MPIAELSFSWSSSSISGRTPEGISATLVAAKHLTMPQLYTIFQPSVNLKETDYYGNTAAHLAVSNPDPRVLKWLEEQAPEQLFQQRNVWGQTVAHAALAEPTYRFDDDAKKLFDRLCQKGLSLYDTDIAGRTVFHYAAMRGKLSAVMDYAQERNLVARSPLELLMDDMGLTPFHYFVSSPYADSKLSLSFLPSEQSVSACYLEHVTMAAKAAVDETQHMLSAHRDGSRPQSHHSLLTVQAEHEAALEQYKIAYSQYQDHTYVAAPSLHLFLPPPPATFDIDWQVLNRIDHPIIGELVRGGWTHAVKQLSLTDDFGLGWTHHAAMTGNLDFFEAMSRHFPLDEFKEHLVKPDVYGRSGLHYAAENGHVNIVIFYASKGIPLDQVDFSQKTALAPPPTEISSTRYYSTRTATTMSTPSSTTAAASSPARHSSLPPPGTRSRPAPAAASSSVPHPGSPVTSSALGAFRVFPNQANHVVPAVEEATLTTSTVPL